MNKDFLACKSCKQRQAIIDYIKQTNPAFLRYRPICRFIESTNPGLGKQYPQSVKHYIEQLIDEGIIEKRKTDCGHEEIVQIVLYRPIHKGSAPGGGLANN